MQDKSRPTGAAASVGVRLPHGIEIVPTRIARQTVRFVTVDRDGSLTAWVCETPPELSTGFGAWVGRRLGDARALGRVCEGNYPAYRQALRAIDSDPRLEPGQTGDLPLAQTAVNEAR